MSDDDLVLFGLYHYTHKRQSDIEAKSNNTHKFNNLNDKDESGSDLSPVRRPRTSSTMQL